MASKKKKSINIRHYKTRQEMNIGILLFAFIFLYLIVTIITYATSKKISVYEVREGSIVKDNSYTGFIMREETVFHADADGYVSYFQTENTKLKAGSNVYVLSGQALETSAGDVSATAELSTEEQNALYLKIQNFNETYNTNKFSSVYSLKNDIDSTLQDASNQSKTAQLDNVIAENGENLSVYTSTGDGLLVLDVDGYEELTEDSLDEALFDRSNYEVTRFSDDMKVKAGQPVYKMVTSENWNVYIQLDEETAKNLADTTFIKTRIDKDNETIWADFSILEKDGSYYGCLSYDNSMIRYSEDRYLNVELIMEDESGLKIPKSAVIDKPFYTIPQEYLTTSGNQSSQGVMIKDGNSAVYQPVDIYYTSPDGEVYLNPGAFDKDTILVRSGESGPPETYMLRNQKTLKGVYCINQGYAVFKQITILCENDDYYIVEEGTSYGLSNYDHIVQDGKTVSENEVVFQ